VRDRRCEGATFYHRDKYGHNVTEDRVRCREDTGHPMVRLCAGCRVIERLEWEKQRKILSVGLKATLEALSGVRFPTLRPTPWNTPEPDKEPDPER
jgi:hypothetical protein